MNTHECERCKKVREAELSAKPSNLHCQHTTEDIDYVYIKVADAIEADIKAGILPVGARLPGERALGARFGVAHLTARRAAKELRERGLVKTLANKGSFVIE